MSKHLTPAVDESWLYRLPKWFRQPTSAQFEFPARPNLISSADGDQRTNAGACGESSTGTGARPLSLPLTPSPRGVPVPVGHLTLIDRIKAAAEKLDDIEEDCA